MEITKDEAQKSLEAVQQVMAQTRKQMASGGGPYFMLIWGCVWFLGFLVSQFLTGPIVGWTWLGLDSVGVVASVIVGSIIGRRVRRPLLDARVGVFWLALVLYSALWIWIAAPTSDQQFSLLIATMAMFGYVVMGLWMSGTLAWVGLGVTALALVGYFAVPGYFNLWMAILGGGTLIGSGIYILRRWR